MKYFHYSSFDKDKAEIKFGLPNDTSDSMSKEMVDGWIRDNLAHRELSADYEVKSTWTVEDSFKYESQISINGSTNLNSEDLEQFRKSYEQHYDELQDKQKESSEAWFKKAKEATKNPVARYVDKAKEKLGSLQNESKKDTLDSSTESKDEYKQNWRIKQNAPNGTVKEYYAKPSIDDYDHFSHERDKLDYEKTKIAHRYHSAKEDMERYEKMYEEMEAQISELEEDNLAFSNQYHKKGNSNLIEQAKAKANQQDDKKNGFKDDESKDSKENEIER